MFFQTFFGTLTLLFTIWWEEIHSLGGLVAKTICPCLGCQAQTKTKWCWFATSFKICKSWMGSCNHPNLFGVKQQSKATQRFILGKITLLQYQCYQRTQNYSDYLNNVTKVTKNTWPQRLVITGNRSNSLLRMIIWAVIKTLLTILLNPGWLIGIPITYNGYYKPCIDR